ncbi:GDSL-type esterase/lipase family protein [Kitasatospora kifunensis]|uniref:Lysophospholipase L1-like esterase n=1 Tax=Kitasatospora kifunensis TaxID=58351 RepID=A0A7W7VTS0_KITKI|nr:GDSL-type esterase/lipase family protein [Kitasatospora kifunensis]MBB4921705.1 lysophospholipase L1-like esterase [Kitasatospora kifunensis]
MPESWISTTRARRVSRPLAALLALPLTATGLLTLAAPAHAATGPTASVTLGDSYISGEAGRWQGNSDDTSDSRDGTDRAWNGSGYDPSTVYGSTYASGCDRSDVAEVNSATQIAQTSINLACSGATTANVFRAADGGQSLKGEAPQADQLAIVAAQNDVKLITLSIGGNDLGFSDVITACAKDYVLWGSTCNADEQSAIEAEMPAAMAGVGKAIDEIRAVMTDDGYAADSYRIVLQSYPSPIPRSSENRYSESGWDRVSTGGCPFWNADSDWARDTMVPEVSDQLAAVAAAKGVQFLDLRDLLQGREVCSTATQLATPDSPPSATTSEWARFVDSGALSATQGTTQESMHPNYYAQLALGRCLSLLWAQPTGNAACRNTPGQDASGMYLASS